MLSEIHCVSSRKIIKSVSYFRILIWDFFKRESNHQEPTGKLEEPSDSADKNLKTFFTFFLIKYFRNV